MIKENNESLILTSEEKILEAAQGVFVEKGFEGATMQEIADRAAINKAALHYYFRSKEKLFEIIFGLVFKNMLIKLGGIIDLELPFEKKLEKLITEYVNFFSINFSIVSFIVSEVIKRPELIITNIEKSALKPKIKKFLNEINLEIEAGRIKPINPHHLYMNLVSMCAFPFFAKPVLSTVLKIDNKEFKELMSERPKIITNFILDSIRIY